MVWEKIILWDVFILLVKPVSGIGIGIWECYTMKEIISQNESGKNAASDISGSQRMGMSH